MGSYGSTEPGFVEGESFVYNSHNTHVTSADLEKLRENDATLNQIVMDLEMWKDSDNKSRSDSDEVDSIQAVHPHAPRILSIPRPHPLIGHKQLCSARTLPDKLNLNVDLIKSDPQKAYTEVIKNISDLEPSSADLVRQGLMDITIGHIETYNSFWLRMTAFRHKEEKEIMLRQMEAILGVWSTGKANLTSASVGQYVLVSNGNRGMHRGNIVHVGHNKDHIRIALVDYGAQKNYLLSRNSIYPFPQGWSLGSCGCGGSVLVSRARMPEIDYGFLPTYPQAFRETFKNAMKALDLRGMIRDISVDGCFEMKLEYEPENKNLGACLATLGNQCPKPSNSQMARCGTFAVAPGMVRWTLKEFAFGDVMYMWPEGEIAGRLLEWIKRDLHILLDKMPPVTTTTPQVNDIVGVCLGADWFRAVVREVNLYHGFCECFLLDLGRTEKRVPFGNIRPLVDDRVFRIPALAVECHEADVAGQRDEPLADAIERHAHNWLLDVEGTKMLTRFIGHPLKVEVVEYVQKKEHLNTCKLYDPVGKYYAVINLYVPVDGETEPVRYGTALRRVLDARNSDGSGYTRSCTVYNLTKTLREQEEENGQDEDSDTE